MRYGVVIIFYNPDQSAINRLQLYSECFEQVLVVDNSLVSNNDAVYNLGLKNIIYKKFDGNQGMSKALNYSFKWAIDSGFAYLLTMDQDSHYSKENINIMLNFIEKHNNPGVGIFSANYAKLYYDKESKKYKNGPLAINKNEIKEVSFCMTSASFMNVKALSKIMPLDDLFIAFVDYDISAKLVLLGYTLLRIGESCFYQQVGQGTNYTFLNRLFHVVHQNGERYYYMIRNNLYFINKYKANNEILKMAKKQFIRILINIVFERKRLEKIKYCILGYSDYKKNVLGEYKKI